MGALEMQDDLTDANYIHNTGRSSPVWLTPQRILYLNGAIPNGGLLQRGWAW